MVVDTTKENICVNQIVGQKNVLIDIEGDVIVPDIKPDILNTINTSGNVCIYRKEIQEGKVRIDGSIRTDIIYMADSVETETRGINTSIDFTETIDIEGVRPGMNLGNKAHINSIEARVLNGRKVNIKVKLEFEIKVFSNENIDVVKEVNGILDIQKLSNNIEVNSLVGQGNTKVTAKDTIPIDQIDLLAEILKVDMAIVNKDVKVSYNKVLIKADADVRMLYLTDDGRINSCKSQIPVMGFVDIPNIEETNLVDTEYELRNIVINPNGAEEHAIYIEAEIEVSASVFEKMNLSITEDLYSPTQELMFTKKEIDTMCSKQTARGMHTIKEKISAPEVMGGRIYDVCTEVKMSPAKPMNDRVMTEGELKINFMYCPENGKGMEIKSVMLPFSHMLDMAGVVPDSTIDVFVDVTRQDFVVMPDGYIDILIELEICINASNFRRVSVIDQIMCEENRNKQNYSMVIYFVKPGDTLWGIAKMFGSTVEDIARANEIEKTDLLQVGRQLFIPRYNSKRTVA